MPHYADNTEAKVGDIVLARYGDWENGEYVYVSKPATIYEINPGAQTCNALIAFFYPVDPLKVGGNISGAQFAAFSRMDHRLPPQFFRSHFCTETINRLEFLARPPVVPE